MRMKIGRREIKSWKKKDKNWGKYFLPITTFFTDSLARHVTKLDRASTSTPEL